MPSRGPSGPRPRLSDTQLAQIEQALLEGATANGFTGALWTLDRIALVVERIRQTAHLAYLFLRRSGRSVSSVS